MSTQDFTTLNTRVLYPRRQWEQPAMTHDDPQVVIFPDDDRALVTLDQDQQQLTLAGQLANEYAALGAIPDYLSRKATNTIRRQYADLTRFADYLNAVAPDLGARLATFAAAVKAWEPNGTRAPDPEAWHGVTWGLVEGFRNWMISQGDAIGSINLRLSTVKTFVKLAAKAGIITHEEKSAIRDVSGYAHKEGKRVDDRRETTRRGRKKAQAVPITQAQARQLKQQPNTPQGRRDALLMCLLLDHGLRVGEVIRLQVSDFDPKAGEMIFYRPKVDKYTTHKLTRDTRRALLAWFEHGDAPAVGPILRGSRKGGALTTVGMTERSATERVRELGIAAGLYVEREHVTAGGKVKTIQHGTLSAHDCRHFWATYFSDKVDVLRLQEAGGWSSLAMPRRYVEYAKIANEGMDFPETEDSA